MKKSRKRIISFLLILTLLIASFAGCKSKVEDTSKNTEVDVTTPTVASDQITDSPNSYGPLDKNVRKDLTALELSYLMGNGINLGNTMEAYGRASYGTTGVISDYETSWGQPVTTQEMITAMKDG